MRGLVPAGALALALCLSAFAAAESDGLRRLETDSSPGAAAKLAELYRRTRSPDQRLWIVRALSLRLRERGDESTMEPLLLAASDGDADLRGPALRGLTGFTSLPKDAVERRWIVRLRAAADSGVKDQREGVRGGAADLQRVIEYWRDPAARTTPAPPEEPMAQSPGWPRLGRVLRWVWILLLPSVVLAWVRMGFPLFDAASREGRVAAAAWEILAPERALTALTMLLWSFLAALLASYGFDLLALALGLPMYRLSDGWLVAYLACAVCLFLPPAAIAAGFSKDPQGPSASACLRALPWALTAGLAIFTALGPMEIVYRLFLRRSGDPSQAETAGAKAFDTVVRALDHGSLRSGYLAAAVMACEGKGLWPALERLKDILPAAGREEERDRPLGLGAFDPRFIVLFAAPMLAFVCALAAKGLPVEWRMSVPVVLLGCLLWSWGVLAGILFAVLQSLEGLRAAARYLRAEGRGLPEAVPGWREL